MNVERFREVIDQLLDAEARYDVQTKLIQVRDFLQQLVQQPQQPQFQTQLATSLEQLRKAVSEFREPFTPVQMKLFEEIRGTEIFVADISAEVDGLIRYNPMTPQVALDKINDSN